MPILTLILIASVAAGASWLATCGVIRVVRARCLYSAPDQERHIHRRPVPRLGGVAVMVGATAGLVTAVLFWPGTLGTSAAEPHVIMLFGLVLGGGVTFAAGLIDDLWGLRPAAKFAMQVVAAVLVFQLGLRVEEISVGSGAMALGWLSLPVTLLWIVGVTNAYNLVDGMDGLATGLGLIAFATIMFAAGVLGNGEVVLVAAAVLGALVGFLPHNFSPARIFLGDSGSQFVGFVLAVLAIQGSMKSATAVIVAVPLFALFIPLLDTVVAMTRRWLRGSPIAQADARHIHHRLLALGLTQRDAVLLLYLLGAGFAGLGVLVGFASPPHLALIAVPGGIASGLLLFMGMRRLGYDEFLLAGKVMASGPRRVRQAIRDRILVEEVAQEIAVAESLEEIQQVLRKAAPEFGMVGIDVCSECKVRTEELDFADMNGDQIWRLYFPLNGKAVPGEPIVLRLGGRVGSESRPGAAQRVAETLGPVVGERLNELRSFSWPTASLDDGLGRRKAPGGEVGDA